MEAHYNYYTSFKKHFDKGGVLLYPSDSLWGLGCDATSDLAIEKLFTIKQRDPSKGLILLLPDKEDLDKYIEYIPLKAYQLMEVYEKPLTIIYPNPKKNISSLALAPDGSCAIRVTRPPWLKSLLHFIERPLISTSANISGQAAPNSIHSINKKILSKVDYILKLPDKETLINDPSQIIRFDNKGELHVLR